MIKFYWYPKCSTCRKARKALGDAGIAFQEIDITEQPPSAVLIKKWLKSGQIELKQLFNTSGQEYRKLGGGELLKTRNGSELVKLLASNGRLVKRPVITDGAKVTVGFRDPAAILNAWK
jgi:arsenate reductase